MPEVEVIFYKDDDGKVPMDEWLDSLQSKARAKCIVGIKRLHALGHELRRPEVDYLRDGIYELRVGYLGVNYRMLYFFFGKVAVILSHGLTKERGIPPGDIEKAAQRKVRFEEDPARRTAKWELS
jgi:phage-related protein